MLISTIGDSSRKIPPNQAVQPKYVFNILITMAQRRGDAEDAVRAYEEISRNGFEPDVFTLTALVDVVGRCDDCSGGLIKALKIYDEMLSSGKTKPNVVTYVTLLRLLGQYALVPGNSSFSAEQIAEEVLKLLSDANMFQKDPENQTVTTQVDHSIYNAALAVCVRITDIRTLAVILTDMREKKIGLNQPTLRILAKFLYASQKNGKDSEKAISVIMKCSDMSEGQLREVQMLLSARESDHRATAPSGFTNRALDDSRPSRPVYVPCLGPGADESLRQSVITHDLDKLLERLTSPSYGVSLSEGDFATLIHQCR
jgi:pentatricopeptide repeat protein